LNQSSNQTSEGEESVTGTTRNEFERQSSTVDVIGTSDVIK
jgi:hypothetical protein